MPGCKGTITNINGTTFTYQEQSHGTNRGIKVWIDGKNALVDYTFRPNPHNADSKWYNKNQPKFYELAGKEIADYYSTNTAWPPGETTITVNSTSYKLELR
jgi:hypothetical protein